MKAFLVVFGYKGKKELFIQNQKKPPHIYLNFFVILLHNATRLMMMMMSESGEVPRFMVETGKFLIINPKTNHKIQKI